MRLIHIRQATEGLITGREVVDERGQILLHRHVPLTKEYVQALVEKGFSKVWVIDPEEEPVVAVEEDVPFDVRIEAHAALRESFESIEREIGKLQGDNIKAIIGTFQSDSVKALLSGTGPLGAVIEVSRSIMRGVLTRTTLAGLTSIKTKSSGLYDHCVDVCAVAIMIGRVAGLTTDRLRQLAAGCLLHDIGKIFLEPDVKGQREIVQHTRLGYELLRASEDNDILTPHVAYEHHEQPDAQGLPRGLRAGNFIARDRMQAPPIPTVLGEIAAVANVYDNLLSGGDDRPALRPDEALAKIREAGGKQLNREVVQAFLRVVPVYPMGTQVLVRGGEYDNHQAVVTRVNTTRLDRPVITVIRDAHGEKINQVEIDLTANPEIIVRSR